MQFSTACEQCILARYRCIAQSHGGAQIDAFLAEIQAVMDNAPKGVAIPFLSAPLTEVTDKYYGKDGADYVTAKRVSNEIMLSLLDELRAQVLAAEDPLRTALAVAQIGNYIDFTALYGAVDFEALRTLLRDTERYLPQEAEYSRFCADLRHAKRLVYLCDNAGEIVADRLVAEQLSRVFPALSLTFAVRGLPTVNDALREDALMAGLDRYGAIIDNGSAISGTEFGYLSAELDAALRGADVILAKGQGNFETMFGCGLNVYYSFLCKCSRFAGFFRVPMLTGMFVNEQRLDRADFVE